MVRGTTINNPYVIKLISINSEAQGTFIQKTCKLLILFQGKTRDG